MKTQITFFIIAFVLFVGCANDKSKILIAVSKNTSSLNKQDFSLVNRFGDTVKIDVEASNGEFMIKISDLNTGYHMLNISDKTVELYLTKNNNLDISLVDDEINFSGSGTEINNYLKRKNSPEFDWYSNYYKDKQKGNIIIYFRDQYIEKLKNEIRQLSASEQFVEEELNELNYKYYNQLLLDKIMLESNPDTDESIIKDLQKAMSINIDDPNILNSSKNYVSVVAKILIAKNRVNDLPSYYTEIKHPNFKTHFLESLVGELQKELQFAEDDYAKAKKVESFINSRKPSDSIGYYIFNLYNQFHEAEGKLTNFSYEDVNGEMVSLQSLRGKYVYVDFWATWCVNCIKEFPYIKNLEEQFKNEKIEFIGISVDRQNAKEKWKRMIVQQELNNIQLFAPFQGYPDKEDIDDDFIKLLYVNAYYLGIPHYALIDPDGKIVDAYFYRPSNSKAEEFISELLLNRTK